MFHAKFLTACCHIFIFIFPGSVYNTLRTCCRASVTFYNMLVVPVSFLPREKRRTYKKKITKHFHLLP